MKLEPFLLERWQSEWENRIPFNLAESGVHPVTLEEVLAPSELQGLARVALGYTQTNGSPVLRAAIAALYPGASVDNVLVTTGTSEANYAAVWRLVEPGDEVVAVLPNYMQLPGAARALGATVVPVWLRSEQAWSLDLDALDRAVGGRTRLICICHPNNPTGAVLSPSELEAVVSAAARHGSWILADEVYREAVPDGPPADTFWGRYERVIVTSGLSKAYGLPGLRIGWVLGPTSLVDELWHRRDYLTISPAALSDAVAAVVLQPAARERILGRTRLVLRENAVLLRDWLAARPSLSLAPPAAGAIAFVRYAWSINSTVLAERLRDEQGVLLVPGDHFQIDGHLRFGFGGLADHLRQGLQRAAALLDRLDS